MPLFRFISPPHGLEDATYDYPRNPDPERYVEVTEPAPAPAPPAAETGDTQETA